MASLGHYVYNKMTNMFSNTNLSNSSNTENPIRRGEWDNAYYHPSTVDVLTVKDILLALPKRDVLPLELVDTIIDHAEYWPRTIAKTSKQIRVNGSPRRPEAEENTFVVSVRCDPSLRVTNHAHSYELFLSATTRKAASKTMHTLPPSPNHGKSQRKVFQT